MRLRKQRRPVACASLWAHARGSTGFDTKCAAMREMSRAGRAHDDDERLHKGFARENRAVKCFETPEDSSFDLDFDLDFRRWGV